MSLANWIVTLMKSEFIIIVVFLTVRNSHTIEVLSNKSTTETIAYKAEEQNLIKNSLKILF